MLNNQFKFRAWDIKNNVMILWHTLVNPNFNILTFSDFLKGTPSSKIPRFESLLYKVLTEENNYIILKYSGFDDQMGRSLFEEDIIYSSKHDKQYIVLNGNWTNCFGDNLYGFYLQDIKNPKLQEELEYGLLLIGNTFENKELLN